MSNHLQDINVAARQSAQRRDKRPAQAQHYRNAGFVDVDQYQKALVLPNALDNDRNEARSVIGPNTALLSCFWSFLPPKLLHDTVRDRQAKDTAQFIVLVGGQKKHKVNFEVANVMQFIACHTLIQGLQEEQGKTTCKGYKHAKDKLKAYLGRKTLEMKRLLALQQKYLFHPDTDKELQMSANFAAMLS